MKIVIAGAGRMGAWLARELSAGHEVGVYDREPGKTARLGGAVPLLEPAAVESFQPDLFLNAVSLAQTVPVFEEFAPGLPPRCLIADVASIKGKIADYYRRAGFPFVSVHPMFGPSQADMSRLQDENAVVIAESCPEGKQFFAAFLQGLGCRLFEYSFAEHDRMMAYSLTTPFVASLVFAAGVNICAVPGTTFRRHLAIAGSLLAEDDHLLAEILFNEQSLPELGRITARLEHLKHIILARDQEEAGRFFDRLRRNIGIVS